MIQLIRQDGKMIFQTAQDFVETRQLAILPRLPLEANIDLTYRCNNDCRHCWVRIPANSCQKKEELTFAEIRKIVDEAKSMGCRRWSISGGEPMLRQDFSEIFDYITSNSASYSINTNGTLITPKIAKLMKRKGTKMVALYGATAEVHDHITRNPGSFEATMRGFKYLKEAGAGFIVQLIPIRDNYNQFPEMVKLAESLSRHYRVGASWLYLSACQNPKINQEIKRQRLPPKEAIELDKPDLSYEEEMDKVSAHQYCDGKSGYLFSSCVNSRRDFHIDPYGTMSFCCFIKDPSLRYDLRKGSFRKCWEDFIPSLAKKVKVNQEYKDNCGSCKLRKDCRWCPVYGYLEHGRFSAKVEYLCAVAKENRKFKENWQKNHRRYYRIADIAVQVESDLPFREDTFHPKFKLFGVSGPKEDTINIRHHFFLPDLNGRDLGRELYRKTPWAIYKNNDSWIYLGVSSGSGNKDLHRVAVSNHDYSRIRIYHPNEKVFYRGNLQSLTLFPTDQILLAQVLADRKGCFLHACGVNFNGEGLLFVGHSEAGKSTMATLLKGHAEILCDDRMIVRKRGDSFRIYGTWSHGDVPEVSAGSAPLKAIMFLKKADKNKLMPIENKKEIAKRLLSCLIKPFITSDWWEKMLSLIENVSQEIPCYELCFDKSGKVIELLEGLVKGGNHGREEMATTETDGAGKGERGENA
ncbi:MAG: radical SAM protein [Candidatus Omnitrophica bacterium]|nr:radical SAM protein [Candidatus Omnitrophota bacterium]